MKITWLTVTLLLGMASLAFAQQSASGQQMMKVRQAMGDEYAAAIAKKDAVAMADHYTADVVTAGLCPEAPPGRSGSQDKAVRSCAARRAQQLFQ